MAEIKDPENTILMELKDGTVTIELLPDVAPKHCARMKELARAGAYDNVVFHRVIDGFMAQTGDVRTATWKKDFNLRRAGTGGSDLPDLPAEFSKLPHDRGTLGAARSQNPNSANSQFFINFQRQPFPERPVHRLRPGDLGHGACRRHHPRRAAGEPRPDAQREGGRRCLRASRFRCCSRCSGSRSSAASGISPARRRCPSPSRPGEDAPGPYLEIAVAGEAEGTVVIDLLRVGAGPCRAAHRAGRAGRL
jgi:peptidylprolyl isomerase